ncbi:hypothetical protein JOB18_001446 [Solea senegalensis]|uniref:Interleukin-4 n=1 Tax=Solea senegalensis TaxID=28829 RepID=A0AAV6SJG0_SOLSE|nr:hypothetical protein JOB18_001446 [Solea senegalensis]
MMKHVFALLVLLHLCYSTDIDMNLNVEIIKGLKELHSLKTINITSPLRVPGAGGHTHVSCLGAFAKELMHLLNNVSVPEEKQDIIRGLKQNLRVLNQHKKTDHRCHFVPTTNTSMVFKRYVTFLRRLNTSKKR